jgi:hypothetical protein
LFFFIFATLFCLYTYIDILGKKTDAKDKEKAERADDSGTASTPNQQQQLSSATPTNLVR